MTVGDEDDWIGEEIHVVPKLDPDDDCNGKKKMKEGGEVVRNDDNHVLFGGYCNNPAGKATDHTGEGRCTFHGGDTETPGAPTHNQNAAKQSLTADPHHYHENLPSDEQQWIEDTTTAMLERIRRIHGRDPDFLDQALAKSIAINFHILSKARDYSKDELVQVIIKDGDSIEEKGALVEEVRRFQNSIIDNIKKLGLLEDPETQKANALGEWREFVDGDSGEDELEVVDVDGKQVEGDGS